MTVGLAAICEEDGEEMAVVAADRMMTMKQTSPIEFEHPDTKLEDIQQPNIEAVAVAAGSSGLGDQFFNYLSNYISQDIRIDDNITAKDIETMENLSLLAKEAYKQVIQQKINNQVLGQYGFKMEDLRDNEMAENPVLQSMLEEIEEKRKEIVTNLNVLIAGVDKEGASIYQIYNGDKTSLDSLGYGAIGSGSQPAQSEFIHSNYGKSKGLEESLRIVTGAKMRSEDAQGVGKEMDIYAISKNKKDKLSEEKMKQLRELQKEINEEQKEIRGKMIKESKFSYSL